MHIFGIILTTVVTLMHVYVFWRARSAPWLQHHVPRKIFIGVAIALWLAFVLGLTMRHRGGLTILTELFAMNWMGVMFLVSPCLLLVDYATGFGFFLRRWVPTLRGCALVAGGVLCVFAFIQGVRPPVVINEEVSLSDLPPAMEGKTIAVLSDLHVGSLLGERWLAARVEQVNAMQPDMVVLLGDLFEVNGRELEELHPVLSRLRAPLGVWVVFGNHESYGRREGTDSLLREAGYHILHDRWTQIGPGLVLAGVDYASGRRRSENNVDHVSKALAGRPPGATIFLSHAPDRVEQAADASVDLMLCGHTHGGQIWPFGYLVRQRYPMLAGRYEVGEMTVLVSRGTGTWGPNMRLWRAGEILRITLLQEK